MDILFVRSATNIFCVSELDAIQLIFDPCSTSWATLTELGSFALFSAAEVPLHSPLLKFHTTTLQSSPPDTSMSFGLNLGKWTWDALEECFLRHSSGTNFFFPSNRKSWMLPLPEMEIEMTFLLFSTSAWQKQMKKPCIITLVYGCNQVYLYCETKPERSIGQAKNESPWIPLFGRKTFKWIYPLSYISQECIKVWGKKSLFFHWQYIASQKWFRKSQEPCSCQPLHKPNMSLMVLDLCTSPTISFPGKENFTP